MLREDETSESASNGYTLACRWSAGSGITAETAPAALGVVLFVYPSPIQRLFGMEGPPATLGAPLGRDVENENRWPSPA